MAYAVSASVTVSASLLGVSASCRNFIPWSTLGRSDWWQPGFLAGGGIDRIGSRLPAFHVRKVARLVVVQPKPRPKLSGKFYHSPGRL